MNSACHRLIVLGFTQGLYLARLAVACVHTSKRVGHARSVGKGSTSSMCLAPVVSIRVRSNPSATPAQFGSPDSSAASRRSSSGATGSPSRRRTALSCSKRARCSAGAVLTSRRHYQFDYVAVAHRPDLNVDEVIYALRFTYPPTPAGTSTADRTDKALEQGSSSRARNTDYWFCGAAALKPIAASDDGVHTRLRFNASAELPALFVRNDDASESLLNFSMDEGDVIVHRVARQFLVRRGRLVGCIVNKGFHGAGERLKSHTVSPQVERSTKPTASETGAAGPTFEGAQP